jgi:thiamine biosynthesis lipoprotein
MKYLIKLTGILLPVLFLYACQPTDTGAWIKISGYTQGTTYNITYLTPDSINYQGEIENLLSGFDRSLSTWVDTSLISKVNQDSVGLSPDSYFETCFRAAGIVNRESQGAFDISIGPLVNAWGFGYTEASEIDSSLVRELLPLVGMDQIRIENGIIVKDNPGVLLDMNAIAQGYAVDVIYEFFLSEGLENYLVEIGGEVRTKGTNPRGTSWRVGIDRPVEGLQIPGADLQAIIEISDQSLATSGNYRRFYEKDGKKYAHTINPKTGWPVRHGLLSATVLTRDCMMADAWATAFMVMGTEKSIRFLEDRKDLQAYLIYNDENGDYRIWYTEGLKEKIFQGLK